jgi:dolichyl-phosphate beta-glucosyltransferase
LLVANAAVDCPQVLMKGMHLCVAVLCSSEIHDTQCGFKLFTRGAAKTLFGALHLER